MNVERGLAGLAACVVASLASAQTFDLEQFDQLFRPRLKVDAHWTPRLAFEDSTGHFEDRAASAAFTFPVYKRWSAGIDLEGKGDGLEDLLKNAVRIRASQVMGNVRYGQRQLIVDGGTRVLHSASIGALGISLTKKYRVLFWSVNANVSEEEGTIDQAVPRFNGIIGKMHLKGMRKQFFYGLTVVVSDGLNVPLPFLGGTAPMGDRWSFQYVLPLQVAMGYRASSDLRFQFGAGADGYRSGFALVDDRVNINYTALRVFANMRQKLSKHLQLRAEVSAPLLHSIRLPDPSGELQRYGIVPGVQVSAGINIYFGSSTLERVMNDVLK